MHIAVRVRLKLRRTDGLHFFDELAQLFGGNLRVADGAVELGAVARRQDHRFGQTAMVGRSQTLLDQGNRAFDFFSSESNAFAHRQRRGRVIEAKTKQLHKS